MQNLIKFTCAIAFISSAILFPLRSFTQNTGDPYIISKDPVCVLPASPFEGYLSIPYSKKLPQGGFEKSSSISVDFLTSGTVFGYTCTTWPSNAQTAFSFATGIWQDIVESSQVINVDACWTTGLPSGTLGSAGTFYWGSSGESIPQTLLEATTSSNYGNPDIQAVFNANRSDWYFGTNANPPSGEYDFVTVVLHEIGHGLGFADRVRIDDGAGTAECSGVADTGCLGFLFSSFFPSTFSNDAETFNGTDLTTLINPSTDLEMLVTGDNVPAYGGAGIFLNGTNVVAAYGSRPILYTPATFASGSTYSHFDLATHANELMKPALSSGQAIHDPNLASEYFFDMGWQQAVLPVELISFSAAFINESAKLNWTTASELNNFGYEVQRSFDGKEWKKIGFVAGSSDSQATLQYDFVDPRPFNGVNYYRIRQMDYDGQFTTSPVRSVRVASTDNDLVIYPVPTSSFIKIKMDLYQEEDLPFEIIDARGTVVKTGTFVANNQLDVSGFPSGIYRLVLNVNGKIITGSFYRE